MKAGRSLAESISAEPMQRLSGAGIWLRHCRSSTEPCRSSMRAAKTLLHKCSWTGAQISYSKERNLVQNNSCILATGKRPGPLNHWNFCC